MIDISSSNQRYWDALSTDWQKLRDQDGLWRSCVQQPELAFDGEALQMIRQFAGDLHRKRVLVIGSGDNYVAFALAGMGAAVTSIFYDIHPFLRPWKHQVSPLEIDKPYTATGPFKNVEHGQVSYEFHLRLSDLLNPLLESGLLLRQMAESMAKEARFWEGHSYEAGKDSRLLDWQANPRAALPAWG